jgi:hypothetical protein
MISTLTGAISGAVGVGVGVGVAVGVGVFVAVGVGVAVAVGVLLAVRVGVLVGVADPSTQPASATPAETARRELTVRRSSVDRTMAPILGTAAPDAARRTGDRLNG